MLGIRLLIDEFCGREVKDRQSLHNAAQAFFLLFNVIIAVLVLIVLLIGG